MKPRAKEQRIKAAIVVALVALATSGITIANAAEEPTEEPTITIPSLPPPTDGPEPTAGPTPTDPPGTVPPTTDTTITIPPTTDTTVTIPPTTEVPPTTDTTEPPTPTTLEPPPGLCDDVTTQMTMPQHEYRFSDIADSPFRVAIECQTAVIKGYPNGTFRPLEPVTRGQMASFISRALSLGAQGDADFSDTDDSVHSTAIAAVVRAGIAVGYTDGTFKPNQTISTHQASTMLVKAFEVPPASQPGHPLPGQDPTHYENVVALLTSGIAAGIFGDDAYPSPEPLSRGEAAALIQAATEYVS